MVFFFFTTFTFCRGMNFQPCPKERISANKKKTESKFALRLVAGEGIEPPAFGL